MTKSEKETKTERRSLVRKKLSELQRKILICSEMLTKARLCHSLYEAEHKRLDRELFEASPGITVVGKKKQQEKQTKNLVSDYEKMSIDDQKRLLTRLLKLQKQQQLKEVGKDVGNGLENSDVKISIDPAKIS